MNRFAAIRLALILAVLATLAVAPVVPVQAAPGMGLSARLDAESAVFDRTEELTVRFTLHNDSARELYVLRAHTPFAGFTADLFEVRRDGEPVPYTGRLVKWGTPTAADYVRIEAGAEVSALFDISAVYDMAQPGNYTASYRAELLDLQLGAGRAKLGGVEVNELTFTLAGEAPPVELHDPFYFKAQTPGFSGCSDTQQSTLSSALGAAENYAISSHNYLVSLPVASRSTNVRYKEWFGVYDSGRYSTVQGNFNAIRDVFSNRTVTFFCDCTDNYYAYVYSNRPYEIHLCNVFWTAPLTGTDSKGGTLIHETSHFTVVAGTDDLAYGQTACRKLAAKKPRSAIRNADSHEYFAEAGGN